MPAPPPRYKSPCQRARVSSEAWGLANLYCVNCTSPRLVPFKNNFKASDFSCGECAALFQLKSSSRKYVSRIQDAAHGAMIGAIREDRTPNIFALQYDAPTWRVLSIFLIPRFALSESAIECRPPLRPTAERKRWVGCNILLNLVPYSARISIVSNGVAVKPDIVRAEYARLRPLAELPPELRGWTLDVFNAIQQFRGNDFGSEELRSVELALSRMHPNNRHVREKIRQQLQVLRDRGLLRFLAPGRYRLK